MPSLRRALVPAVVLLTLAAPTAVFAQASITGVVRDTSGGVLPGVTVEAASPALIEKVRGVTTDGNGQYRIIDLRPGTYALTFTLPGFATVQREGIALTGTFTATGSAPVPFCGTFRLPFGVDAYGNRINPVRGGAAYYLGDDGIALITVDAREKSLGMPTVRLEINLGPKCQ